VLFSDKCRGLLLAAATSPADCAGAAGELDARRCRCAADRRARKLCTRNAELRRARERYLVSWTR